MTAHVARLLARDRDVVCVAMGRGGPSEPELVTTPPTLDELVARSRAGQHAASDYLELAVLTGLPTVGCRRAGGGISGAPFVSNVVEGARLAASLDPDVVVFDGSGAAIPPIASTVRILVGREPFRERISDIVLDELELRLQPTEPLSGRVAVFTAGPAATDHLDAEIVHVSHNLARRDLLSAELERVDADTYLVELKAAAVDVVVEHALAHGRRVVLAGNDVGVRGARRGSPRAPPAGGACVNDRPLVILIGGATGTGKSTVATEIAYKLGITRLTSTDSIRQTLRAFFSHEFMPTIHYSSFSAGQAVPDADDPLVAGFLEQSRNVLVGVNASIERALQEGWSIIFEGVHLVPGLLPTQLEGAIVCPFVLTIEDEDEHARHFFSRNAGSERPLASYLDHIGDIRRLQSFIVGRAEREGIPVIVNVSAEQASAQVIDIVQSAAARVTL